MTYDAVVIGAGAAGLFCAITAGRRGKRVLVVEHNVQPGRKILISGGGRCNFTNLNTTAENFISENPHFAKSALAGYTPHDFVELVRKHRIEFYEKKLGQIFCRNSARQIVEMLLLECERAKVTILTNCPVASVGRSGSGFVIDTGLGRYEAKKLVIAAGGLSFPKVGATDLGYRVARQFGLKIVPTRPALVPLAFAGGSKFGKLAGVSIDATASVGRISFRENILFTHQGLSGPAILQISNYWKPETPVTIDLLPGRDALSLLRENAPSRQTLANFLAGHLPKSAAEVLSAKWNKPLAQLNPKEQAEVAESLNSWCVAFDRTEGYQKAEVTAGGISTAELSSQTLESKTITGLFFIGEVVDVTGWLGGYNFQWAWSSGFACGRAI
ncbi:MAG: NAD(P)/FAD-dependent oxidoreductase [Acidobacteria bacterium]|nr:NAD(P)/FAD-dependent oxidoreductase [Acidobacteriota bacterium]